MANCWVPLSLPILSPVRQVEAGTIRLGLVHMGQSVSLAGGGMAAAGEFVAVLHPNQSPWNAMYPLVH